MLEIIEITFNIIGILILVSFITRNLLYMFLTGIDKTSTSFFSYDFQIGFILIYDKEVEPKYEWMKRLCNFLLVIGVRLFFVGLVILFIKSLSK